MFLLVIISSIINFIGLDQEVQELESKFSELHKQLEDYQKPIEEEIYTRKTKLKDMKLEYGFKQEQIKDIKKQIKKSLAELKYKKEMLKLAKILIILIVSNPKFQMTLTETSI